MKKIISGIILITLCIGAFILLGGDSKKQSDTGKKSTQPRSFNKTEHSIDEPSSIWIVVNKHRPLQPAGYVPSDLVAPNVPLRLNAEEPEMQLRKEAAGALETLVAGAKKDNLSLMVASAYRPYTFQQNLYNRYVVQQGQAAADTQSARPGHSEHQTGLAVDLEPTNQKCEVETCFADTPEGKWVAKNAYTYGFILRYQDGKDDETGYMYEPWHLRYVGKSLATELHRIGNPTLEQFFNLDPAPDYPTVR